MIAFTARSQKDTTKNNSSICFPRYVIVGIQKDLIKLDYCDSMSQIKDSIIINRENKLVFKDSVVNSQKIELNLYKQNEKVYRDEILVYKKQIEIQSHEIKKQKRLRWFTTVTSGLIIAGVIILLK